MCYLVFLHMQYQVIQLIIIIINGEVKTNVNSNNKTTKNQIQKNVKRSVNAKAAKHAALAEVAAIPEAPFSLFPVVGLAANPPGAIPPICNFSCF